jgi:hypothetical protein
LENTIGICGIKLKKYTLIKLSSPGFDLNTKDIYYVYRMLDDCVCDGCKEYTEDDPLSLPKDYDSLTMEDKVYALLGTSCGAEYILEEDGEHPEWEKVEE